MLGRDVWMGAWVRLFRARLGHDVTVRRVGRTCPGETA